MTAAQREAVRREAAAAMVHEDIPPRMRPVVRAYFLGIAASESGSK
jgi:hypothetical protein